MVLQSIMCNSSHYHLCCFRASGMMFHSMMSLTIMYDNSENHVSCFRVSCVMLHSFIYIASEYLAQGFGVLCTRLQCIMHDASMYNASMCKYMMLQSIRYNSSHYHLCHFRESFMIHHNLMPQSIM